MNQPERLNKVARLTIKKIPGKIGDLFLTAMVSNDAPLPVYSPKYQCEIPVRFIRGTL